MGIIPTLLRLLCGLGKMNWKFPLWCQACLSSISSIMMILCVCIQRRSIYNAQVLKPLKLVPISCSVTNLGNPLLWEWSRWKGFLNYSIVGVACVSWGGDACWLWYTLSGYNGHLSTSLDGRRKRHIKKHSALKHVCFPSEVVNCFFCCNHSNNGSHLYQELY